MSEKPEVTDDPSLYPYTEGFICRAWVNVRKQDEEYKVAACKYFGVTYEPKRGKRESEDGNGPFE